LSTPSAHGSLLVIGELLQYSADFMSSRFTEICELIFNQKDSKSSLVVSTVISLIPKLASLSPDNFIHTYLADSANYIIKELRSVHRDQAFLALGDLAGVV